MVDLYQVSVSTNWVTVEVEGPDPMTCLGQAVRGVRKVERDRVETERMDNE